MNPTRKVLLAGATGLAAVLLGGDVLWWWFRDGMMLVLTAATACLIAGLHAATSAAAKPLRGLGWLRSLGRLSYEIYLTHMFVVFLAVDAFKASWDLTRNAVLRIFGWQLALAGLSLVTSIVSIVAFALLDPVPAIPAAISSTAAAAFSAYSLIVIAILYESQRLRSIEGTPAFPRWDGPAAVPPTWGQPNANPMPGPEDDLPRDPDGPPPPPPPAPGA